MRTFTPAAPGTILTTVSLPEDLVDRRSAASVNTAFEALANSVKYLMSGTPTIVRQLNWSRLYMYSDLVYSATPMADQASFAPAPLTRLYADQIWFPTLNVGTLYLSLDEALVNGATLVSATASIDGEGGHGALPAVLPGMSIWRTTYANVSTPLRGGVWVADAPANVAAYEVAHNFTFTSNQNFVVDKATYRYTICLSNENGANALNLLRVLGLSVTQTLAGLVVL